MIVLNMDGGKSGMSEDVSPTLVSGTGKPKDIHAILTVRADEKGIHTNELRSDVGKPCQWNDQSQRW